MGSCWAAVLSEQQAEPRMPTCQHSSALSRCLKSSCEPRTHYRCEFLCCRGSSLGCEAKKNYLSVLLYLLFKIFALYLSVYKI